MSDAFEKFWDAKFEHRSEYDLAAISPYEYAKSIWAACERAMISAKVVLPTKDEIDKAWINYNPTPFDPDNSEYSDGADSGFSAGIEWYQDNIKLVQQAGSNVDWEKCLPSENSVFLFIDAYKNRNKCEIGALEIYVWLIDHIKAKASRERGDV